LSILSTCICSKTAFIWLSPMTP